LDCAAQTHRKANQKPPTKGMNECESGESRGVSFHVGRGEGRGGESCRDEVTKSHYNN